MFKKLKNKRGFSLVELMVVVAIVGVLSSVAIPSYQKYLQNSKKQVYKTDLTNLHKGWLAFSVEQDSFCSNSVEDSSLVNVGMGSLLASKLYGERRATATDATCTAIGGGTVDAGAWAGCSAHIDGSCSTSNCVNSGAIGSVSFTPYIAPNLNAPQTHSFIGFSSSTCTGHTTPDQVHIRGSENGVQTSVDPNCQVRDTAFRMGVMGAIKGKSQYFGTSMNELGIISTELEANASDIQQIGAYCS